MSIEIELLQRSPELGQALESAYAAFARHPRPKHLDHSPTLAGRPWLVTVVTTPLREIPYEAIGSYAGSAMTTVGDVDDFRYFLPRILEYSIGWPTHLGLDSWTIAGNLVRADWKTWTTAEQDAIRGFFLASFEAWLKRASANECADWLWALMRLGEPHRPILARWLAQESADAALQFAGLLQIAHAEVVPGSGYWKDVPEPQRRDLAQRLLEADVELYLLRCVDLVEAHLRAPLDGADNDLWLLRRALDGV